MTQRVVVMNLNYCVKKDSRLGYRLFPLHVTHSFVFI